MAFDPRATRRILSLAAQATGASRVALLLFLFAAACGRAGYSPVPPPDFDATPTYLRFTGETDQAFTAQVVALTEHNGSDFAWLATASETWIHVTPERGVGAGIVEIGVASSALAPGTYVGTVGFDVVAGGGGEVTTVMELTIELSLTAPGWTALDGPYGGGIGALAVDPNDSTRVLAGGRNGRGLWLSRDGGASFTRLDFAHSYSSAINSIAWQPSGRAYLAVEHQYSDDTGGIFRSDDDGVTWNPTALQNVSASWVAVDPSNDDILLAEGEALWRSTDGGASWLQLTPGVGTNFLAPHPTQSGGYLLGSGAGALLDSDGTTFATFDTGAPDSLGSMAVPGDGRWSFSHVPCGDCRYQIVASDDAGASWLTPAGSGLPTQYYNDRFRLGASGNLLWALHLEPYISTDGGELFQLVRTTAPRYNNRSSFVAVVDHPEGALIAHESDGVMRHGSDGLLQRMKLFAHSVTDLDFHDQSGALFGVAHPGGVFRWGQTSGFEALGGGGLWATELYAISVDPRSSLNILIGTGDGEFVYRTSDGGDTWSGGAPGLAADYNVSDIARSPDDPDVIWVARGYGGVYRSIDGGQSYSFITGDRTVTITPVSATVAYFGGTDCVRYDAGTDQGVSVQTGGGGGNWHFTAITVDGSIWCGSNYSGLRRSTDGGQTFLSVGLENVSAGRVAVDPNDPQRFWVAVDGGLFQTLDGGGTYTELGAPFGVGPMVQDAASKNLYVGTNSGGVYRVAPVN